MESPPKRNGRPPKLIADDTTLKTVHGLGFIQATSRECAAVLGVSEPTWISFKAKNPEVVAAFESGAGSGLASLRRSQFALAKKNASMAIWLGKVYLGQRDPAAGEGALVPVLPRLGKKELQHQEALSAGEGSDWGEDLKPLAN